MEMKLLMSSVAVPGLVFAGFDWQGLLIALVGVILAHLMRYLNQDGGAKAGAIGAAVAGGAGFGAATLAGGGVPPGWEQVAIAALSFLITWLTNRRK